MAERKNGGPAEFVVAARVPDEVNYIIAGKRYPFKRENEDSGFIVTESGQRAFIFLGGCAHLNGGSWQVLTGGDHA